MRTHDPILNAIILRIERFILFMVMSLLISIVIWIWVLLGLLGVDIGSVWQVTENAYFMTEDIKSHFLIFRACGVIGVLTTSVFFLIAAMWWRKSGDVHRRGAQFIDASDRRS